MNTKIKPYIQWNLFTVTALMLLGFPLYHVYCYGRVLEKGTAYRIPCRIYDPYHPISGRYVSIYPAIDYHGNTYGPGNNWAKITKDAEGHLQVVEVTEKRPEKGDYLPVNFERDLQKFFMNEKLAPIADRVVNKLQRQAEGEKSPCELEIKVLDGRAVSQELYIDNIPIAEYCRQHSKP